MILFHRSAAAPWGHVASIIKKSPTGDSLFWFHYQHLLAPQVHCSSPWRHTFGTFHHRNPRATNARAELKETGRTQLSSSGYFICKPTTFLTLQSTQPTSPTLPSTQPYQTHFIYPYLQPYNIHNKPDHILHLVLFLELSFGNSYSSLFIPFGVISSLLLLLLLLWLYINFVVRTSRSSSLLQRRSPSLWFEYGLLYYKT